MDEFEKELKLGFLEEASQLLADVEQCFLSLESKKDDPSLLDKIFRLAHNLKGSSKAVGFAELGLFTHEFETFLLKVKNGEIPVVASTITLLLKCNDHLNVFVNSLKENIDASVDSTELINEIKNFSTGEVGQTLQPVEEPEDTHEPAPIPTEEINANDISSAEIEKLAKYDMTADLSRQLAELTSENLPSAAATTSATETAAPPSKEPEKNAVAKTTQSASDESIRVSLARLEKLLNFVGETVILQTVLREQAYNSNTLSLRKTIHQMGKVTKEVQDIAMSLRMVPLKQTFQKMQRIVRDTSSVLGKKVNLILEGEDTEVDKTVLEQLSDPLVHLIRNAVDHGIESGEARVAAGKPEAGTVILRALHQSGKLLIQIVDDGGGIDGEKLRQKAVEKKIISSTAKLSEKECVHLVFAPGFSTKAQVTEVSGRGVGMDVVKTNIESLQGEVHVDTKVGKGTTFEVVLPLTLAIIDGMVIRSGNERYVIPLSHVHESLKPGLKDIVQTTGIGEALLLRGETLPVFRLGKLIGAKNAAAKAGDEIAIIVRSSGQPFGMLVDDIIGQHQVVIKKLGREVQNIKGFSGSAILGDGKPALILELAELISQNKRMVA